MSDKIGLEKGQVGFTTEQLDSIREIAEEAVEEAMPEVVDSEELDERLFQIEERLEKLERLVCGLASESGAGAFDSRFVYKGQGIELGSYPFYEDGSKRPLLWKVAAVEGRRALLLSWYVIDHVDFSDVKTASFDEESELDEWLEEFASRAFVEDELDRIDGAPFCVVPSVYNECYSRNPGYLPAKEICRPTDYAVSKGLENGYQGAAWYLRYWRSDTPGYGVVLGGSTFSDQPRTGGVGLRPAIWVNLD